jgi:hypothetical protein
MTGEQLDLIKTVLDEAGAFRALTDGQIEAFVQEARGDVNGAIYLGALAKARMDGVALPDGTRMENSREYWLGLAAAYRPNRGGTIPRTGG